MQTTASTTLRKAIETVVPTTCSMIVVSTVIRDVISAGRFSSALFPAFLWLASAVPEHHRGGWVASFAALQALNAALFYTWRPMF